MFSQTETTHSGLPSGNAESESKAEEQDRFVDLLKRVAPADRAAVLAGLQSLRTSHALARVLKTHSVIVGIGK